MGNQEQINSIEETIRQLEYIRDYMPQDWTSEEESELSELETKLHTLKLANEFNLKLE